MYVVAQFFNYVGPIFFGMILDVFGPRLCSLVSITTIAVGCFLFGISSLSTRPLFVPGMCLIAFAGPGVQNSIVHLSNLFPDSKATAIAYITGSFGLSFTVFFLFDQLWLFMHLSYHQLFLSYCAMCILNIIISILLWPDVSYGQDVNAGGSSSIKTYDRDSGYSKHNQQKVNDLSM